MKIAILAVTKTGAKLANKVKYYLDGLGGYSTELFLNSKIIGEEIFINTFENYPDLMDRKFSSVNSFSRWMKEKFQQFDGIICVMATGIVVRLIAPYLIHKSKDPAVVVLDEKGQFAISLISGHLGGANELTALVAKGLGAQAVITTATDVQGKLAIDNLARKFNLYIEDANKIKLINSLLLEGQPVDIYTQYPLDVNVIEEMYHELGKVYNEDINQVNMFPLETLTAEKVKLINRDVEDGKRGLVIISNSSREHFPELLPANTMYMQPRNIIIGIGCRRGVSYNTIEEAVIRGLKEAGLDKNSIINFASIDIKKDEVGLIELGEKWQVPIKFFSRDEIDKVIQTKQIENVSISEFVYEKIGVGGVCEPVIVLSNQDANVVLPKTIWQGVTVAIGLVPFMSLD